MEFYEKFIKILNEGIDTNSSLEYIGVTPDDSFKNVLQKLKYIFDHYEDYEKLELTSVLHNVNMLLSDLVDEEKINENYGTEGMEPKLDSDGFPDYSDPQGDSYAAKKGFV